MVKRLFTLTIACLLAITFVQPTPGQQTQETKEQQKRAELQDRAQRQRGQQGRRRRMRGNDANALKVADLAPTFRLKSLDEKSETDLAAFRGKKPVVLFFGSYT